MVAHSLHCGAPPSLFPPLALFGKPASIHCETGDLQVQGEAAVECELQLRSADAQLAKTLLRKGRDLLADLDFNVWHTDFWEPGCSKRLDLVGDFGTRHNLGVDGRVWVELKVFSEAAFQKEVDKWKKSLAESLATEHSRDATLQAVMLLAAKVPPFSGGRWGRPVLHATLLALGSDTWQELHGARRAARG